MTDWIAHKPGDPMPVDGDTVVDYMMVKTQSVKPERADALYWDDSWGIANITAYRIHKPEQQKEKDVKYKAGDFVRFEKVLDEMDALELNGGVGVGVSEKHIISHEPAPIADCGVCDS